MKTTLQTLMTTTSSIHKRSRSDPLSRKSVNYNKSSEELYNIDRHHMDELLEREIEQLKILLKSDKLHSQRVSSNQIDLMLQQDEVLVRREMETVLRRKLFIEDSKNPEDSSITMEVKKLVKEIAGLEFQVMYLERYLLLLYRRFFNNKVTSKLESNEKERSEDLLKSTKFIESPKNATCSPKNVAEDSVIFRSQSSLSHCSSYSFRMSPQQAMDSSYHRSLPFSMLEQSDIDAMMGTYVSENVHKSPNSLSEEMVKCISQVFRQLGGQEPFDDDRDSSSPFRRKESLKVTFQPHDKSVMVRSICRDSEKLNAVESALKHYRSLVNNLEGVNPRKLNHEEKLAFWINIHNSLVMHSILVYGNPKNSMKRVSGLLKAAYNVGGRSLNLDTIQTSILGCRVSRPGQVFRFLFGYRLKGKAGDLGRDYAIAHPEPLLHFGLCSANMSDPSVRIYTPKNVKMELECGKEEYVRSNIRISKDNSKIVLPKLVELYAKDTGLCNVGILDMIGNSLPSEAKERIEQCRNKKHGRFSIDWVAHDFRFGLLL